MKMSTAYTPKPTPVVGRFITMLLCISIVLLLDIYIMLQLSRTYDITLLVLIVAATSGLSALFVLNSISSLYTKLSRSLPRGLMRQDYAMQIVLCSISATLMILPGFISFVLGLITYTKPLRIVLAKIITRLSPYKSSFVHEKFIG